MGTVAFGYQENQRTDDIWLRVESLALGGDKDMRNHYPGRVGLQQRVLPTYRAPFFDALAATCTNGLSVFAGQPVAAEFIETATRLGTAQHAPAHNHHFFLLRLLCIRAGKRACSPGLKHGSQMH
ncbi:MAG: hypothetical protein FJ147_23985 [Deltaproteobacteria bacterium]|nr:hypothetical protein [Deltaproteobacteria bacterium]